MKKITLSLMAALVAVSGMAQIKLGKDVSLKIYGHVRTDLYYNSRDNVQSVDGLFYSYPKDEVLDHNGNDINGADNSNMYTVYSRMGFDFAGPMIGKAKTSAKIEFDFRGNGNDNLSALRLRHAYFNFDWGKNKVLVGQTSHPFFGEVSPQILNLNTGSPFQPFGRAPQIRYRHNSGALQLQAAVVWQSQFKSHGPTADDGTGKGNARNQYPHKNSNIPELALGIDYKANGWIVGVGIDMLSIVPRTKATVPDLLSSSTENATTTYKVDERLTTVSYEAHVKYQKDKLFFAAKSTLGSNFTHTSMLGGYAVKSQDITTGEREYTPFRNSSNWINIVYGKKWKPGIFIGYIKNLGTADDMEMGSNKAIYGTGTNIDQLFSGTFELTYNVPHWKIGAEYNYTSAWYGTTQKNGKVTDTHAVGNNRLVLSATYSF
ncbi:MAG: hypothetical protein IJA03_02230 [Bacteroidaceae bacterium]|nr:hypothetical protein [Bacteroidaceae bacterium]